MKLLAPPVEQPSPSPPRVVPPSAVAVAAKSAPTPGEVFTNALGMKLAWIPPGKAWLGGGGGTPGTQKVTMAQGYYLGVYPITQGQWQALLGNNPSYFSRSYFSRSGRGKDKVKGISDANLHHFPVEEVSWEDVQEFLSKLNAQERNSAWLYRLPAEVEWEYACRGGPVSKAISAFHFYFDKPTNDLSSELANFDGNYPEGKGREGKYLERTSRVGQYAANALGLHDMHGNVWEWCDDQEGSDRVIRGGCWRNRGSYCRAADRRGGAPTARYFSLGFRVARVPSGQQA
jgi:formylglycine-generating enzyme required for sulfatase activity